MNPYLAQFQAAIKVNINAAGVDPCNIPYPELAGVLLYLAVDLTTIGEALDSGGPMNTDAAIDTLLTVLLERKERSH